MRRVRTPLILSAAAVSALLAAQPLGAQSFDAVGTRAQGMAGAFVAVADDATATWWNPAGLANGAYLNAIVERSRSQDPEDPAPAGPGWRNGTFGVAIAYPALGLSYYKLRISQIAPAVPIVAPQPGREDEGAAATALRSISISTFGMTVGQSIGSHFVMASTVKLVRAGAVVSSEPAQDGALDRADDLDVSRHTGFDLDIGAMARFGVLRLGAAMQHVGEPGFGEGVERLELIRQARAGIAMMMGKAGIFDAVTLAFDSDLTTRTLTEIGDTRQLSGGAEIWMWRRRLAARGGLSTDTIADRPTMYSTGASVSLRTGFYVDGAWTIGADDRRTGWSITFRSSF